MSQLLERATPAYRRGYRDGYANVPVTAADYAHGTFAAYDYEEGYDAGQCDGRWKLKRAVAETVAKKGFDLSKVEII